MAVPLRKGAWKVRSNDRGLIAAFPPPFQLVDFIARRFLSVRCDRAVVEVKGYVAKRRVAGDGGIGCFPPHLVAPVITTVALYVIAVDVAGHHYRTGLLGARRRLRRHRRSQCQGQRGDQRCGGEPGSNAIGGARVIMEFSNCVMVLTLPPLPSLKQEKISNCDSTK